VILLDTHIALWILAEPDKLSRASTAEVKRALSAGELLAISVISLFEVANAIRRGRIQASVPSRNFLQQIQSAFGVYPVSESIAVLAGQLAEPFPGDPMDRLIAATAIQENCTLITADRKILAAAACKTLW
jgi:PIN domain nuclease of toxin-antitoxin system